MHVKKGDTVLVIAGNDKGRTGEVRSVIKKKNRVVVEGVNMRWKHKRRTSENTESERTAARPRRLGVRRRSSPPRPPL